MPKEHEYRFSKPVDIREDEDGTVKVSGYAAVFGEETEIGGMFREVVEKGAFRNAIGRDDVVFLINHEGLPLARTASGTLKLEEDDRGLRMETQLDVDDPDVKAIIPKMKRGDLSKMSFAFYPDVEEWDETGDMPLRTIRESSLFDVSIVTRPAYEGTEIGLRSLQAVHKQNNDVLSAKMRMNLALRSIS